VKSENRLAKSIEGEEFIVTAEYLPGASTDDAAIESALGVFRDGLSAVNVADNPFGVVMSSLVASVILARSGVEPICQIITRDRNRIALQSDLLGAASLGINNVLCLSGYHQVLTDSPESAHVYDVDSTQLIEIVKRMCGGELLNGKKIEGSFSMLAGAAVNPFLKPTELNIIGLAKKVEAGAAFIQTQAIFNTEEFSQWLDAVNREGIAEKAVLLAGVLPLESAGEAERLSDTYTDFYIPADVIERLRSAGNEEEQRREGLAICVEIIKGIRNLTGLRGIHILSGGKEASIPEILSASGLR
jgi:methylenetetrahydrofolate reductase (NADPH)